MRRWVDDSLGGVAAHGEVGAVSEAEERLARVARGWDAAAEGYDNYFVPRFAPWVRTAVAGVGGASLPEGPILVPCCGTFPELDVLTEDFAEREIVGIDLAPAMVRRARERAAGRPRVRVVEGDAALPAVRWSGRCAAVVSVFGLQALAEPEIAMASWAAALRPGGRLSVVFWPERTETDGPFALMSDVIRAHVPSGDRSWEGRLADVLTARGAVIERDEYPAYRMSHADAPTFFEAFTRSGPLRVLAMERGDEFVARVRAEFLGRAPAGVWHHRPRARLIVARG